MRVQFERRMSTYGPEMRRMRERSSISLLDGRELASEASW
jgi:hypothetical protein